MMPNQTRESLEQILDVYPSPQLKASRIIAGDKTRSVKYIETPQSKSNWWSNFLMNTDKLVLSEELHNKLYNHLESNFPEKGFQEFQKNLYI